MQPRHRARIAVLQALYEVDVSGHDATQALDHRVAEEPLPTDAERFARALVGGVMQYRAALDEVIRQIAPEWPPDQIACVDRNVLRIGIFEVLYDDQTPLKVAINEAVELAKQFGSDASPRFVNGALGTLSERRNEFAQKIRHQRPS